MILEYIDPEPLTLVEAMAHCRADDPDEAAAFGDTIIPSARALAENKTGAAIRKARYSDTLVLGGALEMGQVIEVESVTVAGVAVAFVQTETLRRTRITAVGYPDQIATITYTAGIDMANHPGVRSWLLMVVAWMYACRELIAQGQPPSEQPRHYTDALLASIDVPAAL